MLHLSRININYTIRCTQQQIQLRNASQGCYAIHNGDYCTRRKVVTTVKDTCINVYTFPVVQTTHVVNTPHQ